MLDWLLRRSLTTRAAPILFAVVLLVAGWFSYRSLTIEAFPDPTDTQVQVITSFAGQPAEEVERRVSIPLERALNGTPHVIRTRSISLFGLSQLTLVFDEQVGASDARQLIVERLMQAELPPNVKATLGPMATPIGEIFRYTLHGGQTDPMQLRTLQDWVIRPALLRVPGVAEVVSMGGMVREIHVEPNPARMAELGVTLDQVNESLEGASANAGGGFVERGEEMFVIRSVGVFRNQEDVERTRVASRRGIPVLVKDVASVTEGYMPRQGIVSRDDESDVVEGTVLMRKGENPSQVLDGIRKRVSELGQRSLPRGVEIRPFYDRGELVDTTLHTVLHNLMEGAALVVFVLFAFTLSLRASLVVATVIPLSLAAAFTYLAARGMSANLLSMGAIDFGIIVDGAVVLMEHLLHRVPHLDPHQNLGTRILRATREVARPTMFALLIIIAAYIPIFSLQRVEGRIFSPMAHTVVAALLGALLVSFTVIPVLAIGVLRRPLPSRESPLTTFALRFHGPLLKRALAKPLPLLILSVATLVASVVLLGRLGSEFLPELNEGSLYVTFTLPSNSSYAQGRSLAPRVRDLLRRTPEVESILTQLGRPEDGTDPKLPNNLEVFVRLKPMSTWRPEKHELNDIVLEMARNTAEIPGVEVNYSQPIRDNVADNIAGQQGQVALKIFGDDIEVLTHQATLAKAAVQATRGSADAALVRAGVSPQLQLHVRRETLARFNMPLSEAQSYVETALAGHTASELWEGEKHFDVTVRLPRSSRESADSIRGIRIPLRDGSVVPLSAVADVQLNVGRLAITRENGRRYIGVRTNVRGRDLGTFVAEARSRVNRAISLPEGYEQSWGGEFENQERAMKRLTIVVPVALLITFGLLYSVFGSLIDALLVMLILPLALSGGVVGLAVAHMTLSVSAAVGFIALLGQAVLNGVLIVSAIRERQEEGDNERTAVLAGTSARLRSVLMTALLAALGVLPAALSHAIGSETQRPIAVVVFGGTLSAALVTLFLLPVVLLLAERLPGRRVIISPMATKETISPQPGI